MDNKKLDTANFPTSASHVFFSWGVLLVIIAIICFVTYSSSRDGDEGDFEKNRPVQGQVPVE